MQTLAKYFVAILLSLLFQIIPDTQPEDQLAEQCSDEPIETQYSCHIEIKDVKGMI
ncbi:MAG TPA: hypothetical protein VKN36_05830 [Eudoraea sp.]|nr:hypothetical protein [Eudoraea sp.]